MHKTPKHKSGTGKAKPGRRRRRVRAALISVLVLVGGYFLVTQSFLTRWFFERIASRLTGGEASSSAVIIHPGGRLTVLDARLRAPGVPGEAATVFSVKRLEATFGWKGLFVGPLDVRTIELDQPMARISRSVTDGSVNIAALSPPPGESRGLKQVPRVIVRGGIIELGEHSAAGTAGAWYSTLKRLDVGGEVAQSPDEDGASNISFHELDGATPAMGGLSVQGRLSKKRIQLTLQGLSLSTWNAEAVPTDGQELFRQTAMQGEVPKATITYDYTGGWEARIQLANVGLNLPGVKGRPDETEDNVPIPGTADPNRLLRMERVFGEVAFTNKGFSGSLKGLVEELPYEVEFNVNGTTADSPFTCTLICRGFELTKRPQVLKFAPFAVRRILNLFDNPTGKMDATARLTRGPSVDGKEAELKVDGSVAFHDMIASFTNFPYRFYNINGEVSFDDKQVLLTRIDGEAPDGVKVHAEGHIAPPIDDADVLVEVHATNLPVDERLAEAMGRRRRVLETLFNEERYRELLEQGLVATSRQHSAASSELARAQAAGETESDRVRGLKAIMARPVFDLGGRADISVRVTRKLGPGSDWIDSEVIKFAQAGLLNDKVPFPLIAKDVTIAKRPTGVTVEGGTYRGVTGGTARVSVAADFHKLDDPDLPFVPDLTLSAKDVPLDAILVNSLPDTAFAAGGTLHQAFTDLHLAGSADFEVTAGMSPAGEAQFTVDATCTDARSRPRAGEGEPRLLISGIAGKVTVTQDRVNLGLRSQIGLVDGSVPPSMSEVTLAMPISTDSQKPSPKGGLTATATSDRLDVSLPVEDLIGVLSPVPAKAIGEARAKFHPSGTIDVRTNIMQPLGLDEMTTTVMADQLHRFQVDVGEGRLELESSGGGVTVVNAGNARGTATVRGLKGILRYDGEPAGEVSVDGVVALDGQPMAGAQMHASLAGGRFESGLTGAVLAEFAPTGVGDFVASSKLRGGFDTDFTLAAKGEAWDVQGTVRPRSAELTYESTPLTFPKIDGSIELSGGDGRLRGLVLTAPGWSVSVDGTWMSLPEGGLAMQGTVGADAAGLPADLVGVLPTDVRDAIKTLDFHADGAVGVKNMLVSMNFDKDGVLGAVKCSGEVAVKGARLDAGVLVEKIDGRMDFGFARASSAVRGDMQMWALLDSLTTAGVSMTHGRVRVIGGEDGAIMLPLISADCHGGRVAGTAAFFAPRAAEGKRRYEAEIQASDVRLASLVGELGNTLPETPVAGESLDESRGRLDAGLSVGGVAGDATTRRGRGTLTVGGGRVVNLPLLVPLIRAMNLQFPISERLDYAFADFYLESSLIVFTDLSVSSSSVALFGLGTATLPDFGIDLRFRTKSRSRIPIFTRVMEGVRDELLTAKVGGTLSKPDVGVTALPGPARFFERLFGSTQSAQQKRLDQIEKRADSDPRRSRPKEREPVQPR